MSTGPETDVVDFADLISESFPLSRNQPPILPSLPRDAVIIKTQRFILYKNRAVRCIQASESTCLSHFRVIFTENHNVHNI